jgi:hypothetical protein
MYTRSHLPGRRYGHGTSNIVEFKNDWYLEDREESVLKCLTLSGIKKWTDALFDFRRLLRCRMATALLHLLKEFLHYASQNTAHMSSEATAHVTQQHDNQVFLIDLEAVLKLGDLGMKPPPY